MRKQFAFLAFAPLLLMAESLVEIPGDGTGWSPASGITRSTGGELQIELKTPGTVFTNKEIAKETWVGRIVRLSGSWSGENLVRTVKGMHGGKLNCRMWVNGAVQWAALNSPVGTFSHKMFEKTFLVNPAAARLELGVGIQEASGRLTCHSLKLETLGMPLDIRRIGNRTWQDETEGDGSGGWSDQGSEDGRNFLRPLRGKLLFHGIPFAPAVDGRALLVMKSAKLPSGAERAKLALPAKTTGKFLYLMHTLCWGVGSSNQQIGTVIVTGRGGIEQKIPVIRGIDVGDWAGGYDMKNGFIGVSAWTPTRSRVGLFLSKFRLNPELGEIASVEFCSAPDGDPIWIVAAATLSDREYRIPSCPVSTVVENAEWKPVAFDPTVIPAGVLDFRGRFTDAPAGKYGFLMVRNGKFCFERRPNQPVRFLGACLSYYANFPEKKDAAAFADQLASLGYNAVRLHLFDGILADPADPSGLTFRSAWLDRMDYFIKCLKDRGIYLSMDLYCVRPFATADGKKLRFNDAKLFFILSPEARSNLLRFGEKLFSHVNPYTGLALREEPALIGVSILNEDSATALCRDFEWRASPRRDIFEQKFSAFLAQRKAASVSGRERARLRASFIQEAWRDFYEECTHRLRAIGLRVPLTGQNHRCLMQQAVLRDRFDFVDNHLYWDHPISPLRQFRRPLAFQDESALLSCGGAVLRLMPTRIAGKPFSVSEFNHCFPNRFRAECGALFGGYAALQDWDILFRYHYASYYPPKTLHEASLPFDMALDPMQLLSERLIALLFLRGDVQRAEQAFQIGLKPDFPLRNLEDREYAVIQQLPGLIGRLGTVVKHPAASGFPDTAAVEIDAEENPELIPGRLHSAGVLGEGKLDWERKFFRSSTGEIELDAATGTMKIVSPRSEVLVFCGAGSLSGKRFSATNQGKFALLSLSSLDELPVEKASRLLLFHLTDCCPAGTKFSRRPKLWLEKEGSGPLLARRGCADVTLQLGKGEFFLYAVDLSGRRIGTVPMRKTADGLWCAALDTFAMKQPCFLYEIVRRETGGKN